MKRENTRKIMVGNVQIGGQNKVVIQSMCNTKTKDVTSTVKQILELEKAGCEIIRVACLDIEDAKAIKQIKEQIHIPIVADIHFDYRIALEAIEAGVDKVRINPGNIGSEERVKMVVDKCKEKNIPIRIGVNAGSLEKDLLEKYDGKPTAQAMVESARKHVEILEKLDFYDYAISLKASNLDLCISAYEEASKTFDCPLHLGITEAGTEFSGTIKSSIGLGILLREGIGDTLRVSLSDDPIKEIKVAKEILKDCNLYKNSPTLVACPTCGRTQIDLIPIAKEVEEFLQTIEADITVAVMGCAVNGPGEARNADIGIAGGIKEGLLFKKGYFIFLCGSKKHPENLGTISHCSKNSYIIEKEDDALKALEKLEKTEIKKLLVISQTTYSLEKFYIIREIIENELPRNIELVIKNTICATTEQRQIETKELSKKVDMMIIIGGKNSSNTKKLYEVAQENCKKSVCIEDYKELEKLQNEIKKEEKIGIMAGASTPQKSIEEVEKYLNGL